MHTVDPRIEELRINAYREMTLGQRYQLMADLNESLRSLQLDSIRREHPNASEHEVRMRLGSRWIKAELMKAAFGWDVEEQGY